MGEARGRVILIRHGETEWSRSGRHTGRTDIDLTPAGEAVARALAPSLARRPFAAVLVSPRTRARRTAELAGLTITGTDDRLAEWDYGDFEGRTTVEVNAERAAAGERSWWLWRDGCPGGESPAQITARVDSLLADLVALRPGGDVALVAHGHLSRVLAARWLGQPVEFGASLILGPAHVGVLGAEHDHPALECWNAPALPAP